MGLDAVVRCRCWESRPPEPELLRGLIRLDEDFASPDLSVDFMGNEHLYDALREWITSFCPHEDMEFAAERIANWAGVSEFVHVLRTVSARRFATLIAAMPAANGGRVDATKAKQMLAELDEFDATGRFGRRTVLIADDDDSEVASAAEGDVCMIALNRTHKIGVDDQGFFVVRDEAIVFRSRRFAQMLKPSKDPNTVRATFRALDSAAVCDDAIALGHDYQPDSEGRYRPRYAEHFRVEIGSLSASDFGYITGSLRSICEASVATGNPILWT